MPGVVPSFAALEKKKDWRVGPRALKAQDGRGSNSAGGTTKIVCAARSVWYVPGSRARGVRFTSKLEKFADVNVTRRRGGWNKIAVGKQCHRGGADLTRPA